MYTLYTDKQGLFECSISLENASLKNSKARLVVEANDMSILFQGNIDPSGKCIVPISKLKNLLEESTKGKIKLEVIADDTYFTPWESDFTVETFKKVTAEIKSKPKNNSILENKIDKIKIGNHIKTLSKKLIKENINIDSILKNKNKLNNIVGSYILKNKINEKEKSVIIEGIISSLLVVSFNNKPKQNLTMENLLQDIKNNVNLINKY